MKKQVAKKKMSALLLALVLMLGVVFPAYALEPSPSATPGLESSVGNDTGDESTNQEKLDELGLAEEDFFITDEVARYIAEFFIRDMAATGNTVWDDDTSIVEIVPMYDATGENIVAYSAELTEGYVTISAYIDMPNIILEWADEGVPIYKSDGLESASAYSFRDNSKIIYLGTLSGPFSPQLRRKRAFHIVVVSILLLAVVMLGVYIADALSYNHGTYVESDAISGVGPAIQENVEFEVY